MKPSQQLIVVLAAALAQKATLKKLSIKQNARQSN